MSSTESYGGICPVCRYDRMLVRYGSEGTYSFDLCPKCGFSYGTNRCDNEDIGEEIFKIVLRSYAKTLQDLGFPVTRKGLYEWVESLPAPSKYETTAFDWSIVDKKELEKIKQKCNRQTPKR